MPTSLIGPQASFDQPVRGRRVPGADDEGWRRRPCGSCGRATGPRSRPRMAATLTALDTFATIVATENNGALYPGDDRRPGTVLGRAVHPR